MTSIQCCWPARTNPLTLSAGHEGVAPSLSGVWRGPPAVLTGSAPDHSQEQSERRYRDRQDRGGERKQTDTSISTQILPPFHILFLAPLIGQRWSQLTILIPLSSCICMCADISSMYTTSTGLFISYLNDCSRSRYLYQLGLSHKLSDGALHCTPWPLATAT